MHRNCRDQRLTLIFIYIYTSIETKKSSFRVVIFRWEKQASRLAFEKHGRSTLASDILNYVGLTMEHFFPVLLEVVDS